MPAVADARDGTLGNFPLTELGTAQRLLAQHGADLRYLPELHAWLVWDVDRWVWDNDGARVRILAAGLHRDIYAEGAKATANDASHFTAWARKCQTAQVINHVVSLASDAPTIRITIDMVDGDPLVVGLDGGRQVIDLASGATRVATRGDLVTRSLGVAAVGSPGKARRWRRFLDEVFEGDIEVIEWVRRFLGYCLTGLNREHVFVFAQGAGANGKTVLINTCERVWGEYVRTIQPETLMAQVRSGSGPSPDLARLAGSRLVLGSETEEGRPLAEALVKQLTGGDRVTARDMYSKPFEFEPRFKMVLAGNHRPVIKGTDNGIWRRIRLLPFNRTFKPSERDPRLSEALDAEAADILAWLVEGCRAYLASGLGNTPSSIRDATQAYRTEEDLVGVWISERTKSEGETLSAVLYANYRAWCTEGGHAPMSVNLFGRRLASRGLRKHRTNSGAMYEGILLTGVMM